MALLRDVVRRFPQTSEAYIGLADAARGTGNAVEEVEELENLARLQADYPMIHLLLARAMMTSQPVNYQGVLEELALAEKQAPSDPEVFSLQGKALFAAGRYREAIAPLQRAIELGPLEASSHYQLARVFQRLGNAELAREEFARMKYLESIGKK